MPYEGLAEIGPNGPRWTGAVRLIPEHLADPLKWKRPRRIFVNSMSDLFHERLSFEEIAQVVAVMAACPHQGLGHTFQVLTKRPEVALLFWRWLTIGRLQEAGEELAGRMGWCHAGEDDWRLPLPNLHLGVSVEDQATADRRVPLLLDCPAAVHFVSAEPLLGSVDLARLTLLEPVPPHQPGVWLDSLRGHLVGPDDMLDARVGWVIAGGESGPGARSMHPDWARSLRDQCVAAGVPFLFKQWGEYRPMRQQPQSACPASGNSASGAYTSYPATVLEDGIVMERVGKKRAGRLLDGRTWDEYPVARP